jgi:hypothetical protein
MTVEEIWNKLEDDGIATYDELCLATSLDGYSKETLYDVLYIRTGYRNFEQMEDER